MVHQLISASEFVFVNCERGLRRNNCTDTNLDQKKPNLFSSFLSTTRICLKSFISDQCAWLWGLRLKIDLKHSRETVSAPQSTAASKRHLFVVGSLDKHMQNLKELNSPVTHFACGANCPCQERAIFPTARTARSGAKRGLF